MLTRSNSNHNLHLEVAFIFVLNPHLITFYLTLPLNLNDFGMKYGLLPLPE